MEPGPYELVPLTDDDKNMLSTIYDYRRRFIFAVYMVLIGMGIAASMSGVNIGIIHVSYKEMKTESGFPNWIAALLFLETIIVGSGLLLLFKRVLPFGKDLKMGMKEKVPFKVIDKQYFPLTNQCYLKLDDLKYQNHETDADTYNTTSVGGTVYLYRGQYSKYFFEMRGRFSII